MNIQAYQTSKQNHIEDKKEKLTAGICVGEKIKESWGTAGAFFLATNNQRDASKNAKFQTFMLSNHHIIANETSNIGDSVHRKFSNDKTEQIGTLFWSWRDQLMDAAIAKVATKKVDFNQYAKCENVKMEGNACPEINDEVKKCGSTTKLTNGIIKSINCIVNYSDNLNFDPKNLVFNQILLDIEADYGDSGSVIVNQNNKVVGLIFLAKKYMNLAFATDIKSILSKIEKDKKIKFKNYV